MAVNSFTRPGSQQYVDQFVPLDLNMIAHAGAVKQQLHDNEEASYNELMGKQFNSLSKDKELAEQAKADYHKKLEAFGDPNVDLTDPNVRRQFHKTKQEILDSFGQNGTIGKLQGNYDAAMSYKKELDSLYDKQVISSEKRDKLFAASLEDYQGADKGGFNGIAAAKDVNLAELAAKGMEKIKAEKNLQSKITPSGDYIYVSKDGTETLTEDRLREMGLQYVLSDPAAMSYVKQDADLATRGYQEMGVDANGFAIQRKPKDLVRNEYIQNLLHNTVHNVANAMAYKNVDHEITDLQESEEAKLMAKHKADALQIPFTVPVQAAVAGSEFKTPTDIANKVQASKEANQSVYQKALEFKDPQGKKLFTDGQLLMLKAMSDGLTDYKLSQFYATGAQADALSQYLMEIHQNNKVAKDTQAYDDKIKRAAGLEGYQIPQALVKEADNVVINYIGASEYLKFAQDILINSGKQASLDDAYKYALANVKDMHKNMTLGLSPYNQESEIQVIEADYKKLKEQKALYLKGKDPNYKKYMGALEENAKTKTQTLGVTTFEDKNVAKGLADIMSTHLNTNGALGANYLATGKPLESDEDYSKIKAVSPENLGYSYVNGELRIILRAEGEKSKGEKASLGDYISVKAPEGVESYLLLHGEVPVQQYLANKEISKAEANPNGTSVLQLTPDGQNPLTITRIPESNVANAPGNSDRYALTLNGATNYYNTRADAIAAMSKLNTHK